MTYGRRPLGYGPDEVGAHPASDSPYAVADLAGNVSEIVVGPGGAAWTKGGSFYQGVLTAMISNNNNLSEPTQRSVRVGLRVCADPAR